jgi:hypothetical protein
LTPPVVLEPKPGLGKWLRWFGLETPHVEVPPPARLAAIPEPHVKIPTASTTNRVATHGGGDIRIKNWAARNIREGDDEICGGCRLIPLAGILDVAIQGTTGYPYQRLLEYRATSSRNGEAGTTSILYCLHGGE